MLGSSRQFEHLQRQTLERLRAHIPPACPLTVERRAVDEAKRTFVGFRVLGPGCEQVGRAAVVTAFIDGYVAAWRNVPTGRVVPSDWHGPGEDL